ncbi:MAG: DUF3078 domain-containing protein [Bacteroidia bacterium]|nr:DUF3078 domain-containing protein [Bacteroidia bacterium]
MNNLIFEKEQIPRNQIADSLKWSIDYLNKLLYSYGEWYLTDLSYKKPIKGVLYYAENDPLDTVITDIRRLLNDKKVLYLIDRRPQDIRKRKEIQGYISDEEIEKGVEAIRKKVIDSLNISNIVVPIGLLEAELSKAPHVPDGNPDELLGRKQKDLPSEFVSNLNSRIAVMQFPSDMSDVEMDTIRHQLFMSYREAYNDSVMNSWIDRVTYSYQSKYIMEQSDLRIKAYKKSVEERNYRILTVYNDKAVNIVNDSLKIALQYLTKHAEADSSMIRLTNLKNEKTEMWTANREMKPIRMFLKNAQNDSLSVVLINNGKGELKLVIDDAIKLTRFAETNNRTIIFETKPPDKKLQKVKLNKIVYPAWAFIGNGSIGFTQTSLSNWAKGGESAMALLVMSKYNANYSKDKTKWENSVEFRYGISQTKTRGFEKNDDKIELQSRYGYSAFKKWYYSAETNFRTQIARGYKFPEKQKPISAFMAPGYFTLSIGLDYKPNKNFSLFLAPFTSKTTYITDTVSVTPSTYGLEPGKKKLWEPGVIVQANWHVNFSENITYDTKAEFCNNYRYTFQKFAFEWEQVLIMRINRSINARVMTQLIYDYNTKFPIFDVNNKEIGREPKWQFKELFTIGLSYRF